VAADRRHRPAHAPGLDDIPNLQWLALRDAAHIDYVIDEMAAASPGSWLARIEPGLTLEPHALQVVADYINLRPDWRLIYTDEDTREADGFSQPCFKPDFNLDLLRAQAYFGSFVVVAKDAFLAAGRYGSHAGAENYDLALRMLDQAGEAAIGHIDQMLAHLPAAPARHAARRREGRPGRPPRPRGLDAEIHDGASFGTRRVQYRWPDAPSSASSSRPATGRNTCARCSTASPPAPATRTTRSSSSTTTAPTPTPSPSWRLAARPLGRPRRVVACPASSAGRPAPTPAPPRPRATTCCSSTTTPTSCRTTGWTA
jgi:hypothetical protein